MVDLEVILEAWEVDEEDKEMFLEQLRNLATWEIRDIYEFTYESEDE